MFSARILASRMPARTLGCNNGGIHAFSSVQVLHRMSKLPSKSILEQSQTMVQARYIHTEKQIAGQATSISSTSESSTTITLVPTPSWLDGLPKSLKWTRPYFELSRLDKPIGSWLLYWPCGTLRLSPYPGDLNLMVPFFQPGPSQWQHIRRPSHFPRLSISSLYSVLELL